MPSPERSAATRAFARLRLILSPITCSIWPKSVVTSKLKLVASLAISASARLIFSSASYLVILCRTSASFFDGVLDLREVVLVGLLVHLELAFVLGQFLLGLLQLQREAGGRLAVAGAEIGLDLGLELGDAGLVARATCRLTRSTRARYCSSPSRPSLIWATAQVVFVLHLGDRIGGPEDVGDLVDLGHERVPQLAKNHRRTLPFVVAGWRRKKTARSRSVPRLARPAVDA